MAVILQKMCILKRTSTNKDGVYLSVIAECIFELRTRYHVTPGQWFYIMFIHVGIPEGTFLFEGKEKEKVCSGCSVGQHYSHEARMPWPGPGGQAGQCYPSILRALR